MSAASEPQVLVIGGGISGLATAWWLAEGGIQVELWEAASRLGGKIRSHRSSGYLTEDSAGILMNYRTEVDRLVEQAGLTSHKQSRGADLRRYVVHHGKLHPVPMQIPAMLLSPLWGLAGKLRMASEIVVAHGGHERETVAEFIRRRLGPEILDKVMDPYVAGTLASDPEQANAWSVLPRLTRLEQRYGSLTMGMLVNRLLHKRRANRAEAFSFNGGMERLVHSLANHPNIAVRKGFKALCVEPAGRGWQVSAATANGEALRRVDGLVLALPSGAAARLLAPLDQGLADLLRPIEYASLTVLHLGFRKNRVRHPLDGTGFLTPRQEKISFNGNLWMSSLFDGRAPAGHALLTTYIGGARHPSLCALPDEKLVSKAMGDLRRLIGVMGDPDYVRVVRHSAALPLYHGHYFERTRAIESGVGLHTSLHLAGNYLHGVSMRDRIVQGERIAAHMLEQMEITASMGTECPSLAGVG